MASFMYLIPFGLNLVPVTAFLTPPPLIYVVAVLFPALKCWLINKAIAQWVAISLTSAHDISLQRCSRFAHEHQFTLHLIILISSSNRCSEGELSGTPPAGLLFSPHLFNVL